MPMSNTTSHDNHDKINSWVSFPFLYEYGVHLVAQMELCYNTDLAGKQINKFHFQMFYQQSMFYKSNLSFKTQCKF